MHDKGKCNGFRSGVGTQPVLAGGQAFCLQSQRLRTRINPAVLYIQDFSVQAVYLQADFFGKYIVVGGGEGGVESAATGTGCPMVGGIGPVATATDPKIIRCLGRYGQQ